METTLQTTDDLNSQEFINLVQVKQEAEEAPHIVYDYKEKWAFLFNDAINEIKPEVAVINNVGVAAENVVACLSDDVGVDAENVEASLSDDEIHTCHWCSYTTTSALELIEHDFEKHSRFYQGRRIHKSYKCPSCEYTSIDPANIRNHFDSHSKTPESEETNANNLQKKTKKKRRRKPSWQTKLKRRREQRRLEHNNLISKLGGVTTEEQRLKRMLQARKYRASLSPEALARRRFNDAARMRLKRALESEDVKAERRRKQAQHAREKRAKETPQQLEYRRTMQRNRAKLRRSLETEDQRESRKERERLRARERRATMTAEKKEHIKEVERLRKRYVRQTSNGSNGTDFIDSAELFTSSLQSYEDSYQQLSASPYPQNCIENEDDLMRFCTVSLHMLADSSAVTTSLPNGTTVKTNKKRGRPRTKVNQDEKLPETVSYETLTTSARVSNLNSEIPTEQEQYSVKHLDIMARLNSEIDTVNSFWKNTETVSEEGTDKISLVEFRPEVERKEDNQTMENEKGEHKEEQKGCAPDEEELRQEEHSSPDKIKTISSDELQEESTLNCLKYSPFTKMDKINKLLERMSGKSEN